MMGAREAVSMDRVLPAPARCGPTPIQPTGEVHPAPASRAGNQAREPRRRRHAPAPAQAPARDTRELGSRRSGQPGSGANAAIRNVRRVQRGGEKNGTEWNETEWRK